MNKGYRVAAINDLSGASRCSLTTALPIISALGINCCVMPTALLSNHTGYSEYFFEDCTEQMEEFAVNWKKMNLSFDCIYSGFLGSEKQIDTVENFIHDFKSDTTRVVIDPVMGDNGEIYTTYTDAMCAKMKRLVALADIITPNLTEACTLCGMDYVGENPDDATLELICRTLSDLGAKSIVLTGCKDKNCISNIVYEHGKIQKYSSELIPKYFTGTGDTFASLICGLVTIGKTVFEAVEFATDFIHKCATYSYAIGQSINEGIACERFLPLLTDLQRNII